MKNNFVAKFMNRFNRSSVEQDSRQELLDKIELLEAELEALRPKVVEKVFKRGDRVEVNSQSGFHQGAKGIVEFVEPTGRVWVRRDRHTSAVFFYLKELDLVEQEGE